MHGAVQPCRHVAVIRDSDEFNEVVGHRAVAAKRESTCDVQVLERLRAIGIN